MVASQARAERPLRIVHLIAATTGAPWLTALAREQRRLGHDVLAVVPSADCDLARRLAAGGVTVRAGAFHFFTRNPFTFFAGVLRLTLLLRRLRADVVHSHLLLSVVSGRLAAWLADAPLRMSMNTGPISLESPLMRIAEAGTVWADTRTIASCEFARAEFVAAGADPERMELIRYAVDQSGFDPAVADGAALRREWDVPEGAPLIGYVAYFYPKFDDWAAAPPNMLGRTPKAHDVLLRAMPAVIQRYPGARAVFVGREFIPCGVEQELRDLAAELGIGHAVIFAGERSDIPAAIAALDISVHCSLTENVGGTVESLLMEKPMIVSRVGGMIDAVRDGETGLVVPPDDPEALGQAIVRLVEQPALARRLGEKGRRLMLAEFSLDRTVADFEALYARTAGRFREAPHRAGYRLRRTLARLCLLPARVLPVYWRLRTLVRSAPASQRLPLAARVRYRLVRLAVRVLHGLRNLRRPSDWPAPGAPLRIAEVAGASHNCEWLVETCAELRREGHDVVAIVDASPGDLAGRLEREGVRVHRVRITLAKRAGWLRAAAYAVRIPIAAWQMARILRRERVDIVHSHIFASVLIARVASALAGAKLHLGAIPSPRHLESPFTCRVDRLSWWLDDVTIAGSQRIHDLYREMGVHPSKLATIHYRPDGERSGPAAADGALGELGSPGDFTGARSHSGLAALIRRLGDEQRLRGAEDPPAALRRPRFRSSDAGSSSA